MVEKYSKGTGPAFAQHVPVHPHGTDPSQNIKAIGQPAVLRQTERFTWIRRGNGSGFNGRMNNATVPASADAEIVVTQANAVPGTHLIRVGDFELRPGVDFAIGAGDAALAANLAAAILALPGYTGATDGVDTVTIGTTSGHGDQHRVEVIEWGAASAFALTATNLEGIMDVGDPTPAAPEFA
jgi:hypothetical protein